MERHPGLTTGKLLVGPLLMCLSWLADSERVAAAAAAAERTAPPLTARLMRAVRPLFPADVPCPLDAYLRGTPAHPAVIDSAVAHLLASPRRA